ncbi:MAG: DUF4238 domain-containing protein, partial [Bacteroidota bacterium]
MKKRRQHYVWKHYLNAWAVNGQICCRRAGTFFTTSAENLANRRDFYRLRPLTAAEIRGVSRLVLSGLSEHLRSIAVEWLRIFTLPQEIQAALDSEGKTGPEERAALDVVTNNLEEELHSKVESSMVPILSSLRHGNLRSLDDDKTYADFAFFLSMQYSRTPRRAADIVEAIGDEVDFDVAAAWGVMRTIFATNMGSSLFERRHSTRIVHLKTAGSDEFITTDQPVVNLHARENGPGEPPTRVKMYHPLTPHTALLVDIQADSWSTEER